MSDDRLKALVAQLSTLGSAPSDANLKKLFAGTVTKIDPSDFSTLFVNSYLTSINRPTAYVNVPAILSTVLDTEPDKLDAVQGDIVLYTRSNGYTKSGILIKIQQVEIKVIPELQEIPEQIMDLLALDGDASEEEDEKQLKTVNQYKVLTVTGLITVIDVVNEDEVLKILR